MTTPSPYAAPSLTCDIVMKGGITSGVIYPRAVAELAQTYRLSSVGGASAGAIAAAAAAAAELGRQTGGFEELDAMPDELAAVGPDGHSTLASFFQPTATAAPLFRLLFAVAGAEGGKVGALVRGLLGSFWKEALAGSLVGLVLVVVSLLGEGVATVAGVVGGLLLLVIGAAAGVLVGALRTFARVAGDGFGMCTGMEGDGAGGATPLTPWLYEKIQSLAGRGPGDAPLTFGDLRRAGVTLRVMTTNLTRHQPMAMPWSTGEFWFDPDEFRRLFPEDVVAWMENPRAEVAPGPTPLAEIAPDGTPLAEVAPEGEAVRASLEADATPLAEVAPDGAAVRASLEADAAGVDPRTPAQFDTQLRRAQAGRLRPWPSPDDLPVIVATRMSLSFPVLIAAVRLWSADFTQPSNWRAVDEAARWRRANPDGTVEQALAALPAPTFSPVWFTDGGLCANLPVHFFDSPLPKHPTFAFNLGPFPPGREKWPDQSENSYLPTANAGGLQRPWFPLPTAGIGAWASFGMLMVHTAREWVDAAQMVMPGYRDRIVTVHHDESEGGMNLSMPPDVVRDLAERGRLGAVKLVDVFAGERPGVVPARGWDNHRWIRFRTAASGLAGWLGAWNRSYRDASPGGTPYPDLAGPGADAELPSYRLTNAQRGSLNERTGQLTSLADAWGAAPMPPAPQPAPRLRLVPDDGTAAGLDASDDPPSPPPATS